VGQIGEEQLVEGAAHQLSGEVEDGEHGARAAGVALVVELQSAGERLASDQPQHEEGESRDQQQRGQPLAGAREVQFEAQAVACAFQVAEGFFDLHTGGEVVDDVRCFQVAERRRGGDEPRFALGTRLLQALVRAHALSEDGLADAVALGAPDQIERAGHRIGAHDVIGAQILGAKVGARIEPFAGDPALGGVGTQVGAVANASDPVPAEAADALKPGVRKPASVIRIGLAVSGNSSLSLSRNARCTRGLAKQRNGWISS